MFKFYCFMLGLMTLIASQTTYAQYPAKNQQTYAQQVQQSFTDSSNQSKMQFDKNFPQPVLPKIAPPQTNDLTTDNSAPNSSSSSAAPEKPSIQDYTTSGKNPYEATKNPYYAGPPAPAPSYKIPDNKPNNYNIYAPPAQNSGNTVPPHVTPNPYR